MSNLRIGGIEDIPGIYKLCLSFHKESPYSHLPISEDKVLNLISEIIKNGLFLLSMNEDEVVGIMGCTVHESLFSHDVWASELIWYITPEYRGLGRAKDMIGAYEYWARMKGCRVATMFCLENDLAPLYNRSGFIKKETAFFKEF